MPLSIRRFLLRFGFFRYCVLVYLRKERKKRADQLWEYRRSIISTLGQITITWATIELIIDHLIAWYHPLMGQEHIQREMPVNFERKMAYINKMVRDDGFDDIAKSGLRSLRTEARRLNKARKLMIHGVAHHRNGFSQFWWFTIREFDGHQSQAVTYPVKDADLYEILRQMSEFSAAISPWVSDLIGLTKNAVAKSIAAKSV